MEAHYYFLSFVDVDRFLFSFLLVYVIMLKALFKVNFVVKKISYIVFGNIDILTAK